LDLPFLTVQGFTQKHPELLHLRTNPGMQVITELPTEGPDEVREGLAFCPWALNMMMVAQNRVLVMSLLTRSIG
jgi:hypothetical protein